MKKDAYKAPKAGYEPGSPAAEFEERFDSFLVQAMERSMVDGPDEEKLFAIAYYAGAACAMMMVANKPDSEIRAYLNITKAKGIH